MRMLSEHVTFKANRLEILLSKTIPYIIPFITIRKRVCIRSFFRDRWRKRLCKEMASLLNGLYADKPIKVWTTDEEYEWTVKRNYEEIH